MEPRETKAGCCCGTKPWVVASVATAVGNLPQVGTSLTLADRVGAWKARWGIGRMHYRVEPGLYAVGEPGGESPVLVSANYKLSFDRLRRELAGLNAWMLVIDTNGINVWCAAGKGTFGTDEIVRRVEACHLSDVVSHRTLIVPQLGARASPLTRCGRPAAFAWCMGRYERPTFPLFSLPTCKPRRRCGEFDFRSATVWPSFRSIWCSRRNTPSPLPRSCSFSPVWRPTVIPSLARFRSEFPRPSVFSWHTSGARSSRQSCFHCCRGGLALKGAWTGIALFAAAAAWHWTTSGPLGDWMNGWMPTVAWALLLPSISSYMSLIYTGSTTYTSLSGVQWEVRRAIPIQATTFTLGMLLWLIGRFT